MKNIARLVRSAAFSMAMLFLIGARSELSAQAAPEAALPRPVSPDELSQTELLKSYLLVRDQLHATQLTIANNRVEAEAAARAQAAAIADKLEAIKNEMATERERHRVETQRLNAERDRQQVEAFRANAERARQQAEAERFNRNVLWIAAAFGGLGMIAMIFIPLIQWRALNRMADASALQGSAAPALLSGQGNGPLDKTVTHSNQRLLSVIDRMEQRILELEHTTSHPVPTTTANPFAAPDSGRRPIPISDQAARIGMFLNRGRSYLDAKKDQEALACFDEILKLDPNHAEALVKRGTVLERLKQDEDAIHCYDRAIKADPKMTLAYLHKGGVCNRLQRYEEALQCYEQALRAEEEGKPTGGTRSPLTAGPWSTGRSLSTG